MPQTPAGRPVLGVALAVVTVALFALGDTLMKILAMRHPVELIAALRYAVGVALVAGLAGPHLGAGLWAARRRGLVLLRGLVLALATLTMGHALRLMPVGETVAIMYLAPFAVMALAVPLLGETVTRRGWLLAGLGFLGVLVILRPGSALDPFGVVLALGLAGLTVVFHLLTRVLSATETAMAMLFHVNVVGLVFFGVAAAPAVASGASMGLGDLGLTVLMGVAFTAGHFLFARAYREAPAALVAPTNYLHFVWAALMGWVAFGHVPDGWTVLGMAMILVSGASIALLAHVQSRGAGRRAEAAAPG